MKRIEIVLPGKRKDFQKDGYHYTSPSCGCAVFLESDNNTKIMYDTGAFGYEKTLIKNLKKINVDPLDIDFVILSHGHMDHYANIHIFKNAKLIQDRWLIDLKTGDMINFHRKFDNIPGFNVTDLEIFYTPGHHDECISVKTKFKDKTWVIAGDAVKPRIVHKGKISLSYQNPKLYLKNMIKIAKIADVIIGGEDGIIKGKKLETFKKELFHLI